eukprot:1886096-Rhodomonas_salina.2
MRPCCSSAALQFCSDNLGEAVGTAQDIAKPSVKDEVKMEALLPIHDAACQGDTGVLGRLIEAKCDVDKADVGSPDSLPLILTLSHSSSPRAD